MLKIVINGEPFKTSATTLGELVSVLHEDRARVATALNGAFVAANARATTKLSAGDAIEILTARQGG